MNKYSNIYPDEHTRSLLSASQLDWLVQTFKAMGDPTRLRLLYCLMQGELCVGDLAQTVEMSESAVSHQLRHLRDLQIVRARKVGRTVYYAIADQHICTLLTQALDHQAHSDKATL